MIKCTYKAILDKIRQVLPHFQASKKAYPVLPAYALDDYNFLLPINSKDLGDSFLCFLALVPAINDITDGGISKA